MAKAVIIKTKEEIKRDRLIKSIKTKIDELHRMGYKTRTETVECMTGQELTHVYLYDKLGNRICFQKYLFTLKP